MDTAITVESLVNAIIEHRKEWDDVIASLSDAQCLQPDVCGFWSVKDVIAHINWFEQQMEWMITHHSLDTPQGELWNLPTDERNAAIYRQYKEMSLAEVREVAEISYEKLLTAIQQLTEEEINNAGLYAGMPGEWLPADIIAQNTWQHYVDHLVDIREKFGV